MSKMLFNLNSMTFHCKNSEHASTWNLHACVIALFLIQTSEHDFKILNKVFRPKNGLSQFCCHKSLHIKNEKIIEKILNVDSASIQTSLETKISNFSWLKLFYLDFAILQKLSNPSLFSFDAKTLKKSVWQCILISLKYNDFWQTIFWELFLIQT